MIQDLLWGLLIYLLYRFIFELVIPITKTFKKMKSSVTQMQQEQQKNEPNQNNSKPQQTYKGGTTNINEEYIDFEEVK